jgi:Fur family ferric uptake transcriptional regulator
MLQAHGLRKINLRLELLSFFIASSSSLSVEEMKNRVGNTDDKVTIYRALDSFEKSGLIHKVPNKSNFTRYALCQPECSHQGHKHKHPHFICESCEETFGIDDIEIPQISIPKGFHINHFKLILEGECGKCSQS